MLRIQVPLDLSEPPGDFDAVKDAVELALRISRAGFAGNICDDVQVTLDEC
jgi:hypothetical protein